MSDPRHPSLGDQHIDASDIVTTDAAKGTVKGLRKLRDGYKLALGNLANLPPKSPELLARAGIDPNKVKEAIAASANNDRIAEVYPAVKKLEELLRETAQANAHTVAFAIEEAAAQTRRRAPEDPGPEDLTAVLEPTLSYQYGPAQKAVATKIKTGKLQPKTAKKTKKTPA